MNVDPVDGDDVVVKEMFDVDVFRVDAVRGPAHRMPFVVMKSQDAQAAANVAKSATTMGERTMALGWHPLGDFIAKHASHAHGESPVEASRRLHGENQHPRRSGESPIERYLRERNGA